MKENTQVVFFCAVLFKCLNSPLHESLTANVLSFIHESLTTDVMSFIVITSGEDKRLLFEPNPPSTMTRLALLEFSATAEQPKRPNHINRPGSNVIVFTSRTSVVSVALPLENSRPPTIKKCAEVIKGALRGTTEDTPRRSNLMVGLVQNLRR